MNEEDRKLEELILAGAVEVAGIDSETGEFLYKFTEKINEIDPEIARQTEESFNQYVYALWELGFLNLDMTDPSPLVSLSDKALDSSTVSELPKDLRMVLQSIIEALRIN